MDSDDLHSSRVPGTIPHRKGGTRDPDLLPGPTPGTVYRPDFNWDGTRHSPRCVWTDRPSLEQPQIIPAPPLYFDPEVGSSGSNAVEENPRRGFGVGYY